MGLFVSCVLMAPASSTPAAPTIPMNQLTNLVSSKDYSSPLSAWRAATPGQAEAMTQ